MYPTLSALFSCCRTSQWRSIYLSAQEQEKKNCKNKGGDTSWKKTWISLIYAEFASLGLCVVELLHNTDISSPFQFDVANSCHTAIHRLVGEQHYHLEMCFWQILALLSLCFLKEMSNSFNTTFTCSSVIVSEQI